MLLQVRKLTPAEIATLEYGDRPRVPGAWPATMCCYGSAEPGPGEKEHTSAALALARLLLQSVSNRIRSAAMMGWGGDVVGLGMGDAHGLVLGQEKAGQRRAVLRWRRVSAPIWGSRPASLSAGWPMARGWPGGEMIKTVGNSSRRACDRRPGCAGAVWSFSGWRSFAMWDMEAGGRREWVISSVRWLEADRLAREH